MKTNQRSSLFRALDTEGRGAIQAEAIARCLDATGIRLADPRLTSLRARLDALDGQAIDPEGFDALLDDGGSLLTRVIQRDLAVPDFADFTGKVGEIFESVRGQRNGAVANYIPQLARVPEDHFAAAICTVDGQVKTFGDANTGFTLQSSCKPLLYSAALEEHGEDYVHQHVGREPSGLSFNELALNRDGLPHNPMLNAGAIMTSCLLRRYLPTADRLEYLSELVSDLCGDQPCHYNSAVWHSERETADRNFALAHHMRERRAFPSGIEISPTLDFFISACAIEVTAANMATMGATFANGGVCPQTGRRIFARETVKNCLSMMYSCGMYDYSGEFAFTVGIPAKSSVSGVILAVIPNVMGIVTWSPRLDHCGNSVRGVEFMKKLVKAFPLHNYDTLVDSSAPDPRRIRHSHGTGNTYQAIYAASIGDVDDLKRLVAHGHDLNTADYDGRTPLHLACAEGQVDTVRYLLQHAARTDSKDRWGNTPLADARRHKQTAVIELFAADAGPRDTRKAGARAA